MSELAPLSWQDRPEPVSMGMKLEHAGGSKSIALTVGNCAVALFRHRPEMDYLAILHEHDDEAVWSFIFDKHALFDWMAGFALDRRRQRELHLAHRTHGTFYDRYGWNPDVVIEDYPHQNEIDTYMEYLTSQDLYTDLNRALEDYRLDK